MDRDYSKYEPFFGSWYITRKIGSGAAGSVYEIQRTDEFGVTVKSALKAITIPAGGENEIKSVLFSGVSEEELKAYYEKIVDGVANEFRVMTKLKGNGHIVSYEDHQLIAHEDDPGWDILMRVELLTPLLDYYQDRQMEESEILKMGVDLCKGLEVCGQFGIIHRDIKPANIFVAPSGDYKLGDFGIAKIVESTQHSMSRKGTYTYMAPEVYRAEPYDQTADIYSLGMVLYQCLNDGRNLFMPAAPATISHDDAEQAFAKRIVKRDIPMPAHGSDRLKAIVTKACAYDPKDRYQNAKAMRLELEALLLGAEQFALSGAEGQKLLHEEDQKALSGETPEGGKKRFRWWMVAAVCAALLAICGVVYAVIPHEIQSIEGIEDQTEIYIGDTLKPDYVIQPDRFADEPITFEVSDEEVAWVDEKGAIYAVGLGQTTMTMTADEYKRFVEIVVVPKVTSIEGIDSSLSLEEGEKVTLKPQLKPSKFSNEKITWEVQDTAVAKADRKTGKKCTITARSAGKTKLIITAGGFTLKVPITVLEPEPQASSGGGYNSYNSDNSSNTGTSGSSDSKSSKSSSSSGASNSSDADRGYFNESDKEYF